MKEDYYKILGVSKNASQDEIKKSFRRLAMKFHPDRNDDKNAESKFKEISEAYDVLSDEEKRSKYNRHGHSAVDGNSARYSNMSSEDIFSSFGDIFGNIFGYNGGRQYGRQAAAMGPDIKSSATITLEEAVLGKKIVIELSRMLKCPNCSGSGCNAGTRPITCETCRGGGSLNYRQGPMMVRQPCHACNGHGTIIKDKCKPCKGYGTKKVSERTNVTLPGGVSSGMTVKLSGRGDFARGLVKSGDLYLKILVKEHDLFERSGNNIIYNLSLDYATACLGGEITVPTIYGNCRVSVPKGIKSGSVLSLNGKGSPGTTRGSRTGSQLNYVSISVPKQMSKEEEELIKKLAKLRS